MRSNSISPLSTGVKRLRIAPIPKITIITPISNESKVLTDTFFLTLLAIMKTISVSAIFSEIKAPYPVNQSGLKRSLVQAFATPLRTTARDDQRAITDTLEKAKLCIWLGITFKAITLPIQKLKAITWITSDPIASE